MTIPAAGYVTYILSAERAHLTAEQNKLRTLDLKRDLGRLFALGTVSIVSIVEVEGCYKGEKEASFAVTVRDTNNSLRSMLKLAAEYQQESVLAIRGENAHLHYCGRDDVELIGRYKALTLDEMEGFEAWSVVKATGQAFTFA